MGVVSQVQIYNLRWKKKKKIFSLHFFFTNSSFCVFCVYLNEV